MFEKFKGAYQLDGLAQCAAVAPELKTGDSDVDQLSREFGGRSFNQGIYRIISPFDVAHWLARVAAAFPNLAGQVAPFGFDWMGRLFVCDGRPSASARSIVLMLEPGTGQALEIPVGVVDFHNFELVQFPDAALADGFYKRWRAIGGSVPAFDECIGYKQPLFLGGADTEDNLEPTTLEVYWELSAQLLHVVRELP